MSLVSKERLTTSASVEEFKIIIRKLIGRTASHTALREDLCDNDHDVFPVERLSVVDVIRRQIFSLRRPEGRCDITDG